MLYFSNKERLNKSMIYGMNIGYGIHTLEKQVVKNLVHNFKSYSVIFLLFILVQKSIHFKRQYNKYINE